MTRGVGALAALAAVLLMAGGADAADGPIAMVVVEAHKGDAPTLTAVKRALHADGATVVRVSGCEPLDEPCIARAVEGAAFPIIAYVAVWRGEAKSTVSVGLVDSATHEEVFVEHECNRECVAAAERVVGEALEKWPDRGSVPLRVTGSPTGALVFDNGGLVGKLPTTLLLTHGGHIVQVRAEGFLEHTLSLAPGAEIPPSLEVTLRPKTATQAPGAKAQGRRWRFALGALLSAAGAGLVAFGATRFADRCTIEAASGCLEFRQGNPGAAAGLLVAGTISLSTGIGLLVRAARKERTHD